MLRNEVFQNNNKKKKKKKHGVMKKLAKVFLSVGCSICKIVRSQTIQKGKGKLSWKIIMIKNAEQRQKSSAVYSQKKTKKKVMKYVKNSKTKKYSHGSGYF